MSLRIPRFDQEALCAQVDPDIFFPDKGDGAASREAKKICNRCPVMTECLAWALENHERYGVWGGAAERERRKLQEAHVLGL